jgi:hypothetical protein
MSLMPFVLSAEPYEGGHWLETFAVYLLTRRGSGGMP